MTEAEWLACPKPHPMLEELEWRNALSLRKYQLWICACVKRAGHLLLDERLRAAVVARDMYADDLIGTRDLRAAEAAAQIAKEEILLPPHFGEGINGISPAAAHAWAANAAVAAIEGSARFQSVPILVLEALRCELSGTLQEPVSHEWTWAIASMEWQVQANLIRDVFGNPFRPLIHYAPWLNPTVRALAESIYQKEAFDRMSALADALDVAGCTNADVLNHCRMASEHVRGCWVVDLLLGKN